MRRNHHGRTAQAYGADVGADIPMAVEFTHALQPMLDAFGTAPNFQLILVTIDETVYSRELAPLAGFHPSVDTRAFLSIPARHDTNRRMGSGFLAELVADHRLTMDEALETAVDLVLTCPREAFKL